VNGDVALNMLISSATFQPDRKFKAACPASRPVAWAIKPRYTPAISWRHSWDAARHPWRPA